MRDIGSIRNSLVKALRCVIDPETGADVYKMRLVQDLKVHQDGQVEYVFSPSSPLCPIALPLIIKIMDAIKAVDGVVYQKITVKNYVGAEELNEILGALPASNQEITNLD